MIEPAFVVYLFEVVAFGLINLIILFLFARLIILLFKVTKMIPIEKWGSNRVSRDKEDT